jgi:IS5 family transposase
MLCIRFMQQWFTLSEPAMEMAFFDPQQYGKADPACRQRSRRHPDCSTDLNPRTKTKLVTMGRGKCQPGFVKVRYGDLMTTTAMLPTQFALSNLGTVN